jgi:D-amino peptidase
MAGEANAAIDAALAGGASEVVVNDSHWQMRNLRAEDLDPRARLVIGDKPLSMTQGVGEGANGAFNAAVFIGYHAGAGHPTGVIAHTYSSATVIDVRVGGVSHNEAALNAIRLGHHGVPEIQDSGDDALAGEVEALLPWAERVVVQRGLGYSLAASLSPAQAAEAIREGMRRALGRLDQMARYEPGLPLEGEIDFRLPIQADYAAVLPGTVRSGGRTVGFGAGDGDAFYRTFLALTRLAATPVAG